MESIFDRMQPAVSDAVWRNRRENLINEQRRIYNENLRTNELVTRHDLLGYIDRKLANQVEPGQVYVDLFRTFDGEEMGASNLLASAHPFEYEHVAEMGRVDHANQLKDKLEKLIEEDMFRDDEERQRALVNLKCLELYGYQQELRRKVLKNSLSTLAGYPTTETADLEARSQSLGDILYNRQLLDRQFYRRTKTFAQ